jgi:hypothetical protein
MYKNIAMLKSLDSILQERQAGITALHTSLNKSRVNFEAFDNREGTLRIALDSFFVFTDQVRIKTIKN